MAMLGYARVSTRDQTLAAQNAELTAAGCVKIYQEQASGAKTDRVALSKVIRRLGPDDVLVVTRLDRLARSTRDLLNILDTVGKRGAGFKSLADPYVDTTTAHGRLVLAIIGSLAEFERELIRARTSEGRKRAMAAGIRFGRPVKMNPQQKREALKRLNDGEETQVSIATAFGVSPATIARLRPLPTIASNGEQTNA